MSSTTEGTRGQALAIFALSLTAVLLAAALAFDTGSVLVERRDEQNAADAAAMAGARYVTSDRNAAIQAAREIAADNGFVDGDGSQVVQVNIPPREGAFAGFRTAIEVKILNTRPSIFAGIAGVLDWDVSARAVAAKLDGVGGPWAFLQLDENACAGIFVGGNGGSVEAFGTIHANSTCESGIQRQAGGSITVHTEDGAVCEVAGGFKDAGNAGGELVCSDREPPDPYTGADGVYPWPDPLADLQPPAVPSTSVPYPPKAAEQVPVAGQAAMPVPKGCPGSSAPATLENPATCQFRSSYAGTTWWLSPGLYPGGIKLLAGTFYLLPGIYYLGGGGLEITGNGTLTFSVDTKSDRPTVADNDSDGVPDVRGGVLFFNTELPNSELKTASTSAMGQVKLNGATADVYLAPYNGPITQYQGIVIWQDQRIEDGTAVVLNGSSTGSVVRGTVYVPNASVTVNGNKGELTLDQVIGATFDLLGNEGSVTALNSDEYVKPFYAAGLVE